MTTADEFETWFEKGVTDGLPVVPPTRERVERMLAGTGRPHDELVGEMPPNYGRLTVEKVAINAVLAGCRPEYLPVVVAARQGGLGVELVRLQQYRQRLLLQHAVRGAQLLRHRRQGPPQRRARAAAQTPRSVARFA